MRRPLVAVLLIAANLLGGCGSPGPGARSARDVATLDAESFDDARRRFLTLSLDAPERETLRVALLDYQASRTAALVEQGDYDAVVSHFADMTELLDPSDLEPGRPVPTQLAPAARFLVEHGSRRGDEPRVLAALLVLSRIEPENEAHLSEYRTVAEWGAQARLGAEPRFGRDFLDFAPALIGVWEEHARLTPAPEVLERVVQLYTRMRDVIVGSSLVEGFAPRGSMAEMRMGQLFVERLPLDVAAVYLRVGDLERAAREVDALGTRAGIEPRLRQMILLANGEGQDAADVLGELAGGFERGRPDVTLALCRLGARRYPSDARFALCLAQMSTAMGRVAEATAWYADAVALAPDQRAVYDEALGRLAQLLEGGFTGAEGEIGRIRNIGRHLETILRQRAERWPGHPADVTLAQLYMVLGRAEMHAGNVHEAIARFEASLAEEASEETSLELAMLRARTGDYAAAIATYRALLAEAAGQGPQQALRRATLLEQLGDALRGSGDEAGAADAYRHAIGLLGPFAGSGTEAAQALVHIRLGVMKRRIGEVTDGDAELRAALAAAPSWRESYAAILSGLVVSDPALPLANEVFRRAVTGLALEHEWRVYFALWVQVVAGRAGQPLADDVVRTLSEQAGTEGWHGRLAAFGAGTLPGEELLRLADTPGQRCEAELYVGAKALASGDRDGAARHFRAAMDTGMVSYFEYTMAQELLGTLR